MEKGDQNPGRIFADEAAAIYERSTTSLMKSNMLLYFAYADFEEVSTELFWLGEHQSILHVCVLRFL